MTAIKHPVLLWGLPVAALSIIFWLSLFCYSAIPVSGADATRALLPGHTPTLPEALVQNLRLPRSLVAVLIGASLALAGTLLIIGSIIVNLVLEQREKDAAAQPSPELAM